MGKVSGNPSGLAAEHELRRHFARKRNGERVAIDEGVDVRGRTGHFDAKTVDISRSGILLEVVNPELAHFAETGDMVGFLDMAGRHFGTGTDIALRESGLRLRGRMIRVTQPPVVRDGSLWIAFEFRCELSEEDCARLGIRRAESRDTEEEEMLARTGDGDW